VTVTPVPSSNAPRSRFKGGIARRPAQRQTASGIVERLASVEKRRKIGDRAALIDQLWAAIEALPDPEPQPDEKRPSKKSDVIAMLRRPEGATVEEVASAMGWQRHTVRGLFSGTLKKKLGLTLDSDAAGKTLQASPINGMISINPNRRKSSSQ
jgi:Protein of unknown function (DUF3489)